MIPEDIDIGARVALETADGLRVALGWVALASTVHLRVVDGVSVPLTKTAARGLLRSLAAHGWPLVAWRGSAGSLMVCAGRRTEHGEVRP